MILYVLRYWPTLTETFVRDEVIDLRAAGLDVRVAALGTRSDAHTAAPLDVPVMRLPSRGEWVRAIPALVAHGGWPARDARRVAWLRAQVRTARRVHVHFAGEAAALAREACLREGVPYSVTVHGSDLGRPHPALAEVLRDAHEVWTVTGAQQADVLATFGVRAHLVRSGVEVAPLPSIPRVPPSSPVVLTVARDVPKKGLDVLDAALARLGGDVDARVVGPCNGAGRGAPGGARRLGPLPHAQAMAMLERATVACLPCRVAPDGDVDGLPVFLLEALARGVPVVTTPVAGISEIVDDDVGWVVPPDDPDALAHALRQALGDPLEAARRGARGPERVRARGCTRAAHAAMVYARLAGGPNPG